MRGLGEETGGLLQSSMLMGGLLKVRTGRILDQTSEAGLARPAVKTSLVGLGPLTRCEAAIFVRFTAQIQRGLYGDGFGNN